MERVFDCCVPNSETLLITSSYFLYVVNKYDKELKTLIKYEYKITLVDYHKDIVALATDGDSRYLMLLSLNDLTIRESIKLQHAIVDMKINENYLIVATSHQIEIYHKLNEKFFEKEPVKPKFGVAVTPVSIVKSNDTKHLMVVCQGREVFKVCMLGVNQVDMQRIDKVGEPCFTQISTCFPQDFLRYPLLMNLKQRIIVLGKRNGQVYVWYSIQQCLS